MPYPGVPDRLTGKMESCVENVMKDGKSKPEAIAICKSRLVSKKALTLTERSNLIREQWNRLFEDVDGGIPWARWIFDNYLVFTFDGGYYQVEFAWPSSDIATLEFDFSSLTQVEHSFAPVRSMMIPQAIRSLDDNWYRAYAVLFSSEDKKDMHGTWFDDQTHYYLDWYRERPWLYHHGIRPQQLVETRSQRIGTWKETGEDDVGIFVEGELDLRHKYEEAIRQLLDDEVLYPSSGTIGYLMRVARNGHVEDWPIAEVSSTVAPSDFRGRPISKASRRAIEVLEGEKGGTIMSLPETLNKLLSRRSTDDVEEVEETEVEESPEGEEETPTTEDQTVDMVEQMKAIREDIVTVATSLDEAIRSIDERLDNHEDVLLELGKSRVEAMKSAVTDPDWKDRLYVATRAKPDNDEEITEEEAEQIRAANKSPDANAGGVFAKL